MGRAPPQALEEVAVSEFDGEAAREDSPTPSGAGRSAGSPERRPGTGRFSPEELTCFRRVPSPSALCGQKAEVYWQSTGGLRRVCSDSGLHTLPSGKGTFFSTNRDGLSLPDSALEPLRNEWVMEKKADAMLPMEDWTASVLDRIFPRSPSYGSCQLPDEPEKPAGAKARKRISTGLTDTGSNCTSAAGGRLATPEATKRAETVRKRGAAMRLMQFRQKILDRFATMKTAFDHFAAAAGGGTKELSRKEFSRFLNKHFGGLSREDHETIFDFLDSDKNGSISMNEFHTAIEAANPVRTVEDLRRKWIALGFSSMRQVLNQMERNKEGPGRLNLRQFGAALSRVGVQDEDEHHNIFMAIFNPNNPSGTVSITELASAVAAVSPSLLLEDIHDRLVKKYSTVSAAYRVIDVNANVALNYAEFMQYASHHWKMTPFEAQKAFRLIDIDKNRSISRTEFVTALKLSEPTLFIEEIRRKVRQRFRSIREVLESNGEFQEEALAPDPPKPSLAPLQGRDGAERALGSLGTLFRCHNTWDNGTLVGSIGSPSDNLQAFKQLQALEAGLVKQTPAELQSLLTKVQLTEADTQMLFDLVDIDGDGRLTPLEFVRGVRLFAPACILENLRLRCLRRHSRVADAFASISLDKLEQVMDARELRVVLERLDLVAGVNVEAVVDLVEPHRAGGVSIGELIAALQSSATGGVVALPPEQRDARARQQIRWQMAPFHRSAAELRLHVRQRLGSDDEQPLPQHAAPAAEAQRPEGTPQRRKEPIQRSQAMAEHPAMKQSYTKVSRFLRAIEPRDSDPILEQLQGYYSVAGSKVANDMRLLTTQQSRFQHHRTTIGHYAVLARPLI